jgi:hypothetical protein
MIIVFANHPYLKKRTDDDIQEHDLGNAFS